VHRTLHCALSGAPAARAQDPLLLCAVRWFTEQLLCAVRCAPDRHCRLSDAPIIGFLKKIPTPEPEARHSLSAFSLSVCSLGSLRRSPPRSPLRRPPLRRRPCSSGGAPARPPFSSGEQLEILSLFSLCFTAH
jgi:hypothetical protein